MCCPYFVLSVTTFILLAEQHWFVQAFMMPKGGLTFKVFL